MAKKFFINTAQFVMVNALTGQRFEPGEPTKAELDDWIKGQEVIKPFVDDEDLQPQGDANGQTNAPSPAATVPATGIVPQGGPAPDTAAKPADVKK